MMDLNNCFTYLYSAGTIEDFKQRVANAGTEVSENIIDLDAANLEIASGRKAPVLKVLVTELFAGSGTTLQIVLETDTDSGFATAKKQVFMTGDIPKGRCAAGVYLINQALPAQIFQRWLRLNFVVDGNMETSGKIIAWIDDAPESGVTQLDLE